MMLKLTLKKALVKLFKEKYCKYTETANLYLSKTISKYEKWQIIRVWFSSADQGTMASSPWTGPQFLRVPVHFLVSSNVAKYSALRSALLLEKTLLWRFKRRYVFCKVKV